MLAHMTARVVMESFRGKSVSKVTFVTRSVMRLPADVSFTDVAR